jgi:hypothetical protein
MEEQLTRSRSLGRDQEVWLVVLAAFLRRMVAGVVHGEKRKRKTAEMGVEGLVFGRFWTQFSPASGHEMQPYL